MDEKDIISTNFDYDVYSGGNAKKYLDEYNEQKRLERKRAEEAAKEASKTDAERKKDEYRRKFEGMSADELFDTPVKKSAAVQEPAPEELLDDDAAAHIPPEIELSELPTLENMMEGEDSPSSVPPDQKLREERYAAGVAEANEMIAAARYRRDRQSMMYGRSKGLGLGYPLGYSSFTSGRSRLGYRRYRFGGRRFNSREERALYIYVSCVFLGAFLAVSLQMPFGMIFLVGGAAGAVSSVIRRMIENGLSLAEAIAESRLSLILAGVAAIVGILFSF